jgi:hypothetical protein
MARYVSVMMKATSYIFNRLKAVSFSIEAPQLKNIRKRGRTPAQIFYETTALDALWARAVPWQMPLLHTPVRLILGQVSFSDTPLSDTEKVERRKKILIEAMTSRLRAEGCEALQVRSRWCRNHDRDGQGGVHRPLMCLLSAGFQCYIKVSVRCIKNKSRGHRTCTGGHTVPLLGYPIHCDVVELLAVPLMTTITSFIRHAMPSCANSYSNETQNPCGVVELRDVPSEMSLSACNKMIAVGSMPCMQHLVCHAYFLVCHAYFFVYLWTISAQPPLLMSIFAKAASTCSLVRVSSMFPRRYPPYL